MSRQFMLIGACALFVSTAAANASPYVVTLDQVGLNVVATGTGNIDLTGLSFQGSGGPTAAFINPGFAGSQFVTGATNSFDVYTSFTGLSFGTGAGTSASTGTGDLVGFALNVEQLYVPVGYVTDSALSSSATWDNATFASLGITPGTYVYTWGAGADQSFTFETTPLPAALPLFAGGLGALGLFGWRRRRKAQA
jgi:hypothetical protein